MDKNVDDKSQYVNLSMDKTQRISFVNLSMDKNVEISLVNLSMDKNVDDILRKSQYGQKRRGGYPQ